MNLSRRSLLVITAVATLSSCYEQAFVPGDEENERLQITNDEFELDQRMEYPDSDIPIDPVGVAPVAPAATSAATGGPALAPSSIKLTLLAAGDPPLTGGQATSVFLSSGNRATVSYATRGAAALGAIDLFQVTGGGRTPRLRSSAAFLAADIFAVTIDEGFAYAAVLSGDETLPTPAVVERLLLDGNKFTITGNLRAQLASFAATSTAPTGSVVYATSGDAGGVYAIDPNDMSILAEYPLDNARWVTWDPAGGRVVVAQGQPGRLSVFTEGDFTNGTLTLLNTFPFPGADVAESKTTVEVLGAKAFVAAGPEGVQVICLDNGQIVGSVPRPDPASIGLDPSVVVTNAVTVKEDLMFISNGEAGVYAAAGAQSFATSACDAPQQITVLGKLRFDDLQSANHVVYDNDYLYVAAGLGGVKIVDVQLGR